MKIRKESEFVLIRAPAAILPAESANCTQRSECCKSRT